MKDLQEKAVLVKLTVKSWSARAQDKDAAALVETQKSTAPGVGIYTKRLLAKEAVQDIMRIGDAAREKHVRLTCPWEDRNYRLLPVHMVGRYRKAMDALIEERIVARKVLLDEYQARVEQARRDLGQLFRLDDYPKAAELEDRYALEYQFLPIPSGDHFIARMAKEEAEAVREGIERMVEAKMQASALDLCRRLLTVSQAVVERLGDDEKGNPKVFRDSLVTNMQETVAVVQQLNLTDDPQVAKTASELSTALAGVEAKHLRPSNPHFIPARHAKVKEASQQAVERLAGYLGGGLA